MEFKLTFPNEHSHKDDCKLEHRLISVDPDDPNKGITLQIRWARNGKGVPDTEKDIALIVESLNSEKKAFLSDITSYVDKDRLIEILAHCYINEYKTRLMMEESAIDMLTSLANLNKNNLADLANRN